MDENGISLGKIDPKERYAFFAKLYDEEAAREKQLADHARNNLTLTAIYSAFLIFVAEKMRPEGLTQKCMFVAVIASMAVAFLFSLKSLAIAIYEAPCKPIEFAASNTVHETSVDFYEKCIEGINQAQLKNSGVNTGKSWWLTRAGYLLLLGISLHGAYFIVQIFSHQDLSTQSPKSFLVSE